VGAFVTDGLPVVATLALQADVPPVQMVKQGMHVGRWAKQNGAALLHGHGIRWSPLFWAASLASGLPLVVTLHNLLPATLSRVEKAVLRLTLGRAFRFIAVSQAVADSANIVSSPSKLRVVYNGVDTARFNNVALPTQAQIRQALAFPSDAPIIACVARLSPEKNIGLLLEAVSFMPHTRLLIVGDGPCRLALEAQATALGVADRVTFTGERHDIPALLRAADRYAQPSREEGLGIAVLEAMASGLPVVASDVGGLREVVTPQTGTLLPPTDPRAWANALNALFPEQGRAGQARVQTLFSLQAMHENTRRVYDEVRQGTAR
jgi:glycosyltransferase involved in cell wall biosynthesis